MAHCLERVIPMRHYIPAIERALLVAARCCITVDGTTLESEGAVGCVARGFDPCIVRAEH